MTTYRPPARGDRLPTGEVIRRLRLVTQNPPLAAGPAAMGERLMPLELADVGSFDVETDVFVAGFGAAGCCVAHAAREMGAEVLVAERASGAGGAAALSEGIVYLGGGTPVQIACGFEDSVDNMVRYLLAACGPEPDEAKVVAYAEASLEHFDWLVDAGCRVRRPSRRRDPDGSLGDGGTRLVRRRGRLAVQRDRRARPRGHLAKTKRSTGWLLMQKLAEAAVTAGADVSYDTRVERLVVDDGRVVGAVATRYGERVAVKAHRGVVLTAGGFIWNDEMLRRHAPALLLGTWKVGTEADDGRGIEMAQAVGARVKNMHAGEVSLPIIPPRQLIEGDHRRRRRPALHQRGHLHGPGRPGRTLRARRHMLPRDRRGRLRAQLDGPRGLLGVRDGRRIGGRDGAPGGLARGHPRPLQPPRRTRRRPGLPQAPRARAAAARPHWGPSTCGGAPRPYAPFTLGGLETTVAGEVLDLAGAPIPGLFAAGRTTSGICSFGYASGLSIGDSTLFGRFAGNDRGQVGPSHLMSPGRAGPREAGKVVDRLGGVA